MFDDLDNKNSQNQAGARNFSGVPASPAKAEDIFAGVDQGGKPEIFKPKDSNPSEPHSTVIPQEATWRKNKILIFSLLCAALLIVVVGGYFGLKLAIKGMPETTETVIKQESAANQATGENQTVEPSAAVQENETSLNESITPTTTAVSDSDQDGLNNDEEAALGTDANNPDTDNDNLTDREEAKVYGTDPLKDDTDGDSYKDGDEIKNGYNPKGPGKFLDSAEISQ